MRIFTLTVTALLLIGSGAQAGQLFPPANIGGNPNVPCPNGSVLSWTGDSVACQNPSAGVSVTACPTGQVMTGIDHGVPNCVSGTGGFGGMFVTIPAINTCKVKNPFTSNCTCPSGYTSTKIDQQGLDFIYYCYKAL